jgi:hypothetical protein
MLPWDRVYSCSVVVCCTSSSHGECLHVGRMSVLGLLLHFHSSCWQCMPLMLLCIWSLLRECVFMQMHPTWPHAVNMCVCSACAVSHISGYPLELHSVTTADGYILQMKQIIRPGCHQDDMFSCFVLPLPLLTGASVSALYQDLYSSAPPPHTHTRTHTPSVSS